MGRLGGALIRIPHPLPHFFERRFFTVHENSDPINFRSEENHEQHCPDEQNQRKCNFPPFHAKGQSGDHGNRGSKRDDGQPKCNRTIRVFKRGHTSVHRNHHGENRIKGKLLCIGIVINGRANRCKNRTVKQIAQQEI